MGSTREEQEEDKKEKQVQWAEVCQVQEGILEEVQEAEEVEVPEDHKEPEGQASG